MRKAFGLMIVLLLFGSVSTIWCVRMVYAEHDQVQFTETVLAGDPSAAEGLSIRAHATYNDQLFWDSNTVFNRNKPLTTQTKYHFFNTEQKEESENFYNGVELYSDTEGSGAYIMDMSNQIEPVGIDRAYQELYNIVQPGQELEKTITVADYYDYYPLSGIISLQGIRADFGIWMSYDSTYDQSILNKFEEFFQIPVLPTEQITISLGKDSNGATYTKSSNEEGEQFYFHTQGVVTPTTCYFSFNNRTNVGSIVDTSLIPGGYGIYAFDYTAGVVKTLKGRGTEITENGCLHLDSLRMVFPIDPTEEFLQLSQWEDDGTLLLYTRRKNDYFLTIIEMYTMRQIQRLKIQSTQTNDGAWYNLLENDDFIVTVIDQTATVLLPNGDGTFRIDMQTPNTLNLEYLSWHRDSNAMAYNNGKLAVAYENIDQTTGFRYAPCFDAVIFDNTGLVFLAQYQSSLRNVLTDSYNSNEIVRLVDQNPIEVTWK